MKRRLGLSEVPSIILIEIASLIYNISQRTPAMYDSFSLDYDRFVNWPDRLAFELPFIQQQLGKINPAAGQPLSILDAACGTGMHALALAQQGYLVTGADLSTGMIERARVNAEAAGVQVRFAAAGFGALALESKGQTSFPFDALLCLGNSLPHLLTRPDLDAALADFAACLKPGGLLLIQNRNFDAVMAQRQRWMDPQAYQEARREWIFMRFYDFEADGLINFNIVTLYWGEADRWVQTIHSSRLRPLMRGELAGALLSANFHEITCYGGMDGSPFDPATSGNLVITAQKN
jgi:SAM-dependent methyltransferase